MHVFIEINIKAGRQPYRIISPSRFSVRSEHILRESSPIGSPSHSTISFRLSPVAELSRPRGDVCAPLDRRKEVNRVNESPPFARVGMREKGPRRESVCEQVDLDERGRREAKDANEGHTSTRRAKYP